MTHLPNASGKVQVQTSKTAPRRSRIRLPPSRTWELSNHYAMHAPSSDIRPQHPSKKSRFHWHSKGETSLDLPRLARGKPQRMLYQSSKVDRHLSSRRFLLRSYSSNGEASKSVRPGDGTHARTCGPDIKVNRSPGVSNQCEKLCYCGRDGHGLPSHSPW